tara:strand:- start:1892 stop:2386 length:495 start_codon:yes stop_codon:yes gene_type:complete
MANQGDLERLQPSLLDRLTDDNPSEVKESARERVIDMRRLKEIVMRDLGWLLNTVNQDLAIPADTYPYAAKSTLNYGITDVSGKRAVEARPYELERMLHVAIEAFEPRIIKGSLQVDLSAGDIGAASRIVFNINADLWAEPVPMEVYLRTELDVASGNMVVNKA